MTFTTASGLLPAGIAVYVQRGPNGVRLEMGYPLGLEGFTSQSDRGRSRTATQNIYGSRLRCRSAPVFGLRMHQGGFQNLDGVLAPVQGSDRVHIEIHT